MKKCNARSPGGGTHAKCDLPKGHRGQHQHLIFRWDKVGSRLKPALETTVCWPNKK